MDILVSNKPAALQTRSKFAKNTQDKGHTKNNSQKLSSIHFLVLNLHDRHCLLQMRDSTYKEKLAYIHMLSHKFAIATKPT
jgi:hypothetical protein